VSLDLKAKALFGSLKGRGGEGFKKKKQGRKKRKE